MTYGAISVRGNHDDSALFAYRSLPSNPNPFFHYSWVKDMSEKQARYLDAMPFTITIPKLNILIAHAGIVPGIPLQQQKLVDLYKMRFLRKTDSKWEALETEQGSCVQWANVWKGHRSPLCLLPISNAFSKCRSTACHFWTRCDASPATKVLCNRTRYWMCVWRWTGCMCHSSWKTHASIERTLPFLPLSFRSNHCQSRSQSCHRPWKPKTLSNKHQRRNLRQKKKPFLYTAYEYCCPSIYCFDGSTRTVFGTSVTAV